MSEKVILLVEDNQDDEELARAAIGVDAQRGDVLAVENLSFQEIPLDTPPPPSKSEHWRRLLEPWAWVLRYVGLAALFAVVYLLILSPITKQALAAFRELPKRVLASHAAPAIGADGMAINPLEGAAQSGGQRAVQLKKMLTDKVKSEPAAASRLVESWMREDKDA